MIPVWTAWLTGFAPNDAGRNFFDRIRCFAFDRPLAIDRLTEHVQHASQQTFARRDLQQLARVPNFIAFVYFRIITEDDCADFGFFEVQRQARDAMAEIEHLVQLCAVEPFNLSHAISDFANCPDVLFREWWLLPRDLALNFLQQRRHKNYLTVLTGFKSFPLWPQDGPGRFRHKHRCPP